jgi:hypothetical protein
MLATILGAVQQGDVGITKPEQICAIVELTHLMEIEASILSD